MSILHPFSRLLVKHMGEGIVVVSFNRPEKLNAIDLKTFEEVRDAARHLSLDRTVRAIVLTGEGPDFSSGLDVKSVFGGAKASAFVQLLFKRRARHANLAQSICTSWREVPVPVIAAVKGRCWGAGLQAALGADIRIAHPDARLCLMESRWGLVPDCGGIAPLAALVKKDVAAKLVMFGQEVDGAAAESMGLVTSTDKDPLAAALALARTTADLSPDSVAGGKRLLNIAYGTADDACLAAETSVQAQILLRGGNVNVARKRGQAALAAAKGAAQRKEAPVDATADARAPLSEAKAVKDIPWLRRAKWVSKVR